jgi:hypothetical protein
VIGAVQKLYGLELEPEVRDWLDSLSGSAAALNADVHLTAGHDLGSVWFETHAA